MNIVRDKEGILINCGWDDFKPEFLEDLAEKLFDVMSIEEIYEFTYELDENVYTPPYFLEYVEQLIFEK